MALIVLVSASGSPGVTTAAVGLALSWPRPVLLVEADPTGGSATMAGYLRGALSPGDCLVDLVFAHRDGALVDAIPSVCTPIPDTGVTLLPGTRAHGQARSLGALWEPLTAALRSLDALGQDVIVDAGRLGLAGSPEPLVYGADCTLLVTRTNLVALSGARSWAHTLHSRFEEQGALASLGLLLVGEGSPYGAREVSTVLAVPVTASLARDDASARVFAHGAPAPRKFGSRPLVRSLRAATTAIQDRLAATRPASTGAAGPTLTGLRAPPRPSAALNGYASTKHGGTR